MKNYFTILCSVLLIVVSSCSKDKDDQGGSGSGGSVTISKTVNFTVDPSSIQGAFSMAEVSNGDLESFSSNFKLNVLLFIYDASGNLVSEFSETFSNYMVQMKKNQFLAQGKYTAIAITHVSNPTSGFAYWEIEGKERLEGLRIKNTGYVGNEKEILGTSVEQFEVNDNISDVRLDVKPAGALVTVLYDNTEYLRDNGFSNLRLNTSKMMDYLEFDRAGTSKVVERNSNGSLDFIFHQLSDDYLGKVAYDYVFILPMNNVWVGFRVDGDDGDTYIFGEDGQIDFEKGASYYIMINTTQDDFYMDKLTMPLWDQIGSAKNDKLNPFISMPNVPIVKSREYVEDSYK